MLSLVKNFATYLSCFAILNACGSGLCPLGSSYNNSSCRSGAGFQEARGVIDTSFGVAGKALATTGASTGLFQIALQSDGKIVGTGTENAMLWAMRFNTTGSLDTTFNGTGYNSLDYALASVDYSYSVALQSDGKILLGGAGWNGANTDFVVARFLSSGVLDTTFGTSGAVALNIAQIETGRSLAIQPDGKILLGGIGGNGSDYDFLVARFSSSGVVDTTFGTSVGYTRTTVGTFDDRGYATVLQPDGKIILLGNTMNGVNLDLAMVRYNSSGVVDTTFATAGEILAAYGAGNEEFHAGALQSDGKIIGAGYTYNGTNNDVLVQRYSTNGILDTTFGTNGTFSSAIGAGNEGISSVLVQPNGKIVAAGSYHNGANYDFLVIRLNSNGTVDTSFGINGVITAAMGTLDDTASSVVMDSSGALYVGGTYVNGASNEMAILKIK
jgi:uncharacterized delta-60 repeat protein